MTEREPVFFALGSSRGFGEVIAKRFDASLGELEECEFEDGEHKIRLRTNVRDREVFVVLSLHADEAQAVNDKLCRLLFFLASLRDASARRVTAVVPYLCYSRMDRRTHPGDPVTTRYVAALFESAGTDRLITLDVHDLAAFQNAFRSCRGENLPAAKLFAEYFRTQPGDPPSVVMSPDSGGVKRAEYFARHLSGVLQRDIGHAFMEKHRGDTGVTGEILAGEVRGKSVVILDDMVSTGTTLARAAQACHRQGAARIQAAVTHGLFVKGAEELLDTPFLERMVVTNSVVPCRLSSGFVQRKVITLDATGLIADAIHRILCGEWIES